MDLKWAVVWLTWISLVVACAQAPTVVPERPELPEPPQVIPERDLFAEAEAHFHGEAYPQALELYNAFVSTQPGDSRVPAALMRLGDIYRLTQDYGNAATNYLTLIQNYPQSPFVPRARMELLRVRYADEAYEILLQEAQEILPELTDATDLTIAHGLMGEAHAALQRPVLAVESFFTALLHTPEDQRELLLSQLSGELEKLTGSDIALLLERLDTGPATGLLMYQLGLRHIEEEAFESALNVLNRFLMMFPDHEHSSEALLLTEELAAKYVFIPYTIGCILPLSGRYEAIGRQAMNGIELAMEHLLTEGLIPPVRIIVKDSGADPNRAIEAVHELYQDQVGAIIGPIVTAENAAHVAKEYGLPIITLTQKKGITAIGDYVFRNFLTPRMQVQTLVAYAVEMLDVKYFAVLYPEDNYGKTFMNLFWDEVLAYGASVVGLESYQADLTDFADPIKKLVGLYYPIPEDLKVDTFEDVDSLSLLDLGPEIFYDEGQSLDSGMEAETQASVDSDDESPRAIIDFEALFIPDAPPKAGLILPQLVFHDVKGIYLLGTNLWHSHKLLEMADQYAQGAILTSGFFPNLRIPEVADFVADFIAAYDKQPGFLEAVAYDSANMLFEAVHRSEARIRTGLRDTLSGLAPIAGATGQLSFNENREIAKPSTLLRVQKRHFVEVPLEDG